MAIIIKREGEVNSVPRGTLNEGDLVEDDGTIINAVADRPLGIVADEEPTENAPELVDIYGRGTIFKDTALDGVDEGQTIWSDGDGTYSTTEPSSTAGDKVWALGFVREIDTESADTGAVVQIDQQLYEIGA